MIMLSSPEALLAEAYDNLIELRGADVPFEHEAAMVAEFTRHYIQNLFHLSEAGFKSFMQKHKELHDKACSYERRGKNPMILLQQRILQQDELGKILDRFSQHLGALDCMLDVRATAALVHHMIKFKPHDDLPAKAIGCEFGSGLGILSIAASIPFVRKGISLTVHAFEQADESRREAQRIAEILQTESKYNNLLQFHFHDGDITKAEPYRYVRREEECCGPIALWISETFGYRSRTPVVEEGAKKCSFSFPSGTTPYPPELEKVYDPLPLVLDLSCLCFDAFLDKIRTGLIVAFPDIVKPTIIINGKLSSMQCPDGVWRKLHEIGQAYDMLPACNPTRWFIEDNPKPKKKRTFTISPKKLLKRKR